jgi:hypothetical protein
MNKMPFLLVLTFRIWRIHVRLMVTRAWEWPAPGCNPTSASSVS